MKITIISIGKFENSPYKKIFEEYFKRISYKIELKEIDAKGSKNIELEKIKLKEAELINKNLSKGSFKICLDENGSQYTSIEFSKLLNSKFNEGSNIDFIIGGAFGLDKEFLRKSNITLSLGKLTLPHIMARIILIEQIYRAESIIKGHPYHKE